MGYLLVGIITTALSVGGLLISRPDPDGRMKPFLANGIDTWVAVAITVGLALGLGALLVGVVSFFG
jgi:hypothetical protein